MESMNKDPNPDTVKLIEGTIFPLEVIQAQEIHNVLPEIWDGMGGNYLGKDWSVVGTYLDAYEVEDKTTVLFFIKVLDIEYSKIVNENLNKERKKEERKSQANINVPNIK